MASWLVAKFRGGEMTGYQIAVKIAVAKAICHRAESSILR